jgi:hypothetical protein
MDARRLSRLMSLVLRHNPGRVGIMLDGAGWVPVESLLAALNRSGAPCTRRDIEDVVRSSDKQRFTIEASTDKIRANQGHSIPVELGAQPRSARQRGHFRRPRRMAGRPRDVVASQPSPRPARTAPAGPIRSWAITARNFRGRGLERPAASDGPGALTTDDGPAAGQPVT